jgi:hypothetical protein
MRRALIELAIALGLLLAIFVADFFAYGAGFLGIFVVPFVLMAVVDIGRALRRYPTGSRIPYLLGLAVGLPQLLLALASIVGGVTITVAFFFLGEARHWWIPLVGALIVVFGVIWLRDSLRGSDAA